MSRELCEKDNLLEAKVLEITQLSESLRLEISQSNSLKDRITELESQLENNSTDHQR
jgi:hypothetical protein